MAKARIAILITAVMAAVIAIVFALSSSDTASESSSAERTRASEPATTTEPIPQPRQEGLQPPPSDVAGVSKAEGEPPR